MTAEEARKLRDKNILCKIEMDAIYRHIDNEIERCAKEGKTVANINIDGCDEDWDTVYAKRDMIIEHYQKLGYNIECNGYDRCITSDTFTIEW